jgi:hypothetical protein
MIGLLADSFSDSASDETKELDSGSWMSSGNGVEEGGGDTNELRISDSVDGLGSIDSGYDFQLADRVALTVFSYHFGLSFFLVQRS